MEDHSVRALLLDALARLGVEVRSEPLPESPLGAGGLCTIRGRRVLFLDPRAHPRDRTAALVRALRALPTDEIFLHPALRALLGAHDPDPGGEP